MPESLTFKVPGRPGLPRDLEPEVRQLSGITVKKSVAVRPPVRGGNDWQTLSDVDPRDVIELEFADGGRRYTRADQLAADIRATEVTRGASGDEAVVIPLSLGGVTTRGFVQLGLAALQVLDVPKVEDLVIDQAAEFAARKAAAAIAAHFENDLRTGLFHINSPSDFAEQIVAPIETAPSKPILLFLHGTASSTAGSFSGLEGKEEWKQFQDDYDRILTLEHRTLSLSPIENAIAAAELLPPQAHLHLVSHSRGGLVGELLCVQSLRSDQIAAFEKAGREDQAKLLRQFDSLLRNRAFVIEKFVRVACPSRGTLLASDRVDLYFSLLLEVLKLVPAIAGSPVYPIVKSALLALIHEKATPRTVPGIEAMRPESPFIALLNRPDLATQADLAIISGRADLGGVFHSVVKLAADAFYLEPNDFVVNTGAMYGGMLRPNGASYFADRGSAVSHFNYFKNDRTRQQAAAWLRGEKDRSKNLFVDLELRKRKDLMFPEWRGVEEDKRPILIYVPPLLGSYLGNLWLHVPGLLPGDLDHLNDPQLTPVGVAPYRCARLLKYLASAFSIKLFAYDWRQPLSKSAADLAEFLNGDDIGKASGAGRPVRILAFSSGGLLLNRLNQEKPDVWKTFCDKRGAALQLGDLDIASKWILDVTKNDQHPLTVRLALVDGRSPGEIRNVFADIQGLQDAANMSKGSVPLGTSLVVGYQSHLEASRVWYSLSHDGNLADTPALFPAIADLLTSNQTERLARKASYKPRDTHPPVPVLFPSEEDLFDAAFGAIQEEQPGEAPVPLEAFVTHGHLREARFPVAVGHYVGDSIVSAEKVIDNLLAQRLSNRFALGQYPAAVGTTEVVEAPACHPPGALVIGFGEVGKITPEVVRSGVALAAERHALQQLENSAKPAGDILDVGVSALLLGTYGGNALSVRKAISAVVEGIAAANRTLRSLNLGDRVRISTLEFVELYEDLAIQAARELVNLETRFPQSDEHPLLLQVHHQMETAPGGLFHRPYDPYEFGWWRRVEIVQDDTRGQTQLKFTVLTDRARAEATKQVSQSRLVETNIRDAIADTHYDQELAIALFELLLPNDLKDQLGDKANIIWVVDDNTSEYPWELLALRTGGSVARLASSIGMLRQFVTPDYRPNPRSCRESTALVIGDPVSHLPELPQARKEAEAVHKLLESARYLGPCLIGDDATAPNITTNLFARDYRILHLAGHGQYSADATKRGMIIGDDVYLTAAELSKLRVLPELVFLNCCHLGKGNEQDSRDQKMSQDFRKRKVSRLAGSVAKELINAGVKAVIAAGWAVDDEAAITFASEFYKAMLEDREKFGAAVERARHVTADRHPSSNTAGAYQCYGNPDFSLGAPRSSLVSGEAQDLYVSRREYLDRLRNISSWAKGATAENIAVFAGELSRIEGQITRDWLDGEILTELGKAYGELDRFDEAIVCYEKALSDTKALAPVVAAEQLANLLCRLATKLPEGAEADALNQKSQAWIEWTIERGRSPERLSNIASRYKKLPAATPEARRANFELALKYYNEANEEFLKQTGRVDTYSKINALGLQLILGDGNRDILRKEAEEAHKQAVENSRNTRNLWDRAGEPDALTILYAVDSEDTTQREQLVKCYKEVLGFASPREKGSVLSQLRFLHDNLTGAPKDRINEILSNL